MYESYCAHKQVNINAHLNNPKLSEQMRNELREFKIDYSAARKLSVPAQESYVRSLSFFGEFLIDKHYASYKDAKKDDIKEYLRDPYPQNGKPKSDSILTWLKSSLKVFYRYLLTGKLGKKDPYPELVDSIEVGVAKGRRITDKDLITPDEFLSMLDATRNSRDRAFLYLLFESGCRLGEALNIRLEDVHFERERTYFYITRSKTEPRQVFIFDCVRDLKAWMNQHPQRNNPKAYLFTRIVGDQKDNWNYCSAYSIVRRAVARAGITKKVWIHLFRHTAATADARRGMPLDIMQMKFGWSHDSRMPYKYMHKNPEDLRKWEELQRGISTDKVLDPHAPKVCYRCEEHNDWTSKFCDNCGMALDQKALQEYNEMMEKASQLQEARIKLLEEKVVELSKK